VSYWIGVIGTWVLADGVSSLYTYSNGEKAKGQSWAKDHSLRLLRCLLGITLIILGALWAT
jgi:hypothetical protein